MTQRNSGSQNCNNILEIILYFTNCYVYLIRGNVRGASESEVIFFHDVGIPKIQELLERGTCEELIEK